MFRFGCVSLFGRVLGLTLSLAFAAFALVGRAMGEDQAASISARDAGGFARIEFRFARPVGLSARLAGSVLVIDFEKPVAVSPEKLPQALPAYLAAARLDPERKSMRFALTRPVRIDVKEAAERMFIDLLPTSWTGPPPPLPDAVVRDLARRARAALTAGGSLEHMSTPQARYSVSVRLASSGQEQRIVFEAPDVERAELSQNDGGLRVRFPQPLALDVSALRSRLAQVATDVRVEDTPEGPTLALRLRDPQTVRTQQDEGVFLIELPGAPAPTSQTDAAAAPRPETVVAAAPAAAPESAAPAGHAVMAKEPAAPKQTPEKPAESGLPATFLAAPADDVPTRLEVSARGQGVRLTLTPRVPAAILHRGDEVWMILQNVRSLRLPPQASAERALVKAMASDDLAQAVLLRITPQTAGNISVGGAPDAWTVDLGPDVALVADPVQLRRSAGADGRRILRGALPGASDAVWLEDPHSGERIAVVTMSGAPHAVLAPQTFAEAQFLATALGVAVAARADDITLRTELDAFTLQREGGLALSLDQRAVAGGRVDAQTVINSETWAADRRGSVRDTGRALLKAAADSPKRDRTAARVRYAQFLLANGLGAEAGGVLALASAEDTVAGQTKTMALLRAIAAVQTGDLAEARKFLAHPSLALEGEATLWRAFVDAAGRRPGPALVGFRQSLDILDKYPESLQAQLRPALVQTALDGGDAYLASQQAGEIERLDAGERDAGLIPLLHGKIAEANGRASEALAAYGQAAQSPVRPVEAEARLHQALLLLKERPAERERIVAELETIAMIWRRGDVEVRARAKLSDLYAGEGRWREAFTMTKRAVEIQPEHPLTRKLQDETARRFEALFLEGQDEKLTRVEALAIFDEFRLLVPPGPRGDEIVRRLADRLYDLDLLDQAAELLSHQVEHRLKGVARSQVGARLAVVHLTNGKPQEALKVLRATRLGSLPGELRRARVMLEARTLAELSRTELAIDVLAAETGSDIERLRADIYWRGKRWRDAGEAYERGLGLRYQGDQPLEDAERGDAIRAGVAYALANDRLGLDRFRTKFLAKMTDSPDAETFRLVTLDTISRPDAFRETARNVVSAQTLGDFLDAYRKRYPDEAGRRREARG